MAVPSALPLIPYWSAAATSRVDPDHVGKASGDFAAFLVASFSSRPKYAGTVITTSVTFRPVSSSASSGRASQNNRRDGRRCVLDTEEGPWCSRLAHFPLDERDDLLGILAGGRFGGRADDHVALVLEEDHRGGGVGTLAVAGDRSAARLVDVTNDRICRPQVNPEDPLLRVAHNSVLSPVADSGPCSRGAPCGVPGVAET